jgi:hypothetical protein
VETAATKTTAAKPVTAAAAKTTATAVASSASASAPAATTGQGNRRRKHANRGSCDEGYDRFAQHDCTP